METRTRMAKAIGSAVAVAGVLAAMNYQANAATASTSLSVSATVANNCTIGTTAVTFPSNYDPVVTHASAPLNSTAGQVTIACTKGSTTPITLNLGSNATGSTRRLTNGAGTPSYLTYELYHDSIGGTVWGTSGANVFTPPAAPSKAARSFTVYAQISAGQDVPAGTYTDTVTATVTF